MTHSHPWLRMKRAFAFQRRKRRMNGQATADTPAAMNGQKYQLVQRYSNQGEILRRPDGRLGRARDGA